MNHKLWLWKSHWKSKVNWTEQAKYHKMKGLKGIVKDGNVGGGDFGDDAAAGVMINEDAFWEWLFNCVINKSKEFWIL